MINRAKAVWEFVTSPNYSRTVSILALLVVVLAIPLTVFIAQQQQEIRQHAAVRECSETYDGRTFSSLTPEIQAPFLATYGDQAEAQWIQQHNAQLVRDNPLTANDNKTLFDEPNTCAIIRLFYSVHRSNAPQQWVNERNAAIGAPAPTATPPPSTTSHRAFEPCPEYGTNTTCNPNFKVPNIADSNNRNQDLYCRKIGSSTNDEFEWVTKNYSDDQCSSTQIGRTAECGSTTYYCNGRRGGWSTTQPVPPTVTLTPGPTGITICGKDCYDFTQTSLRDMSNCQDIGRYIQDNGGYNTSTRICNFECKSVDSNYQPGPGGCGQRPIPVPTIGGCGDSCGPGEPVPQPTAGPAPTAGPTQPPGALTKLLFDLILPGATKDKRIVAQIFTATPAAQIGQDLEGTVKRSTGGNFTGTVDVVNTITSGTYNIKVKAGKYLRKLILNIQITQNTITRISQITLALGDINGDNKLNISDFNILVDCFGNKANSQTCGNNNKDLADLDDNERVDGVDYNLFLINLSKGPRDGD